MPEDHEFGKDLATFDGVREMGLLPLKVIVVNIFREAKLRAQWLASGGVQQKKTLPRGLRSRKCPSYLN